jgi:KaiC/GvpD/RAD55 family RecA-like ATPase
MTEPKDQIRSSKAELLAALRDAGADVSRPNAMKCPFHEDHRPSAGVYQDDEGVWRFKCQATCCGVCFDVFDVRERTTGETVESQLSALRKEPEPTITFSQSFESTERWIQARAGAKAVYPYTNPDTGKIDLLIMRIENEHGKTFRQAHLNAAGRIVEKAPAKPHPIYNRSRVRTADTVIVVEGEKCVHALHDIGVVATTAPGGAGKGRAADANWTPLAGKTVILWPDHDPVGADGDRGGHRHMRDVAEQLKALSPACSIWWINPDLLKLGDKEDVADYLDRFEPTAKADAISDAIDLAVPMGGASELQDFINEVIAGKRSNIPFPFKHLSDLTKALLPGTVCVLVGDPGSTKSMMMMQCVEYWQRIGVPIAAYMLEDDRRFHLQRVLAQLDMNANLTDDEWIRQYPGETQAAMDRHRDRINGISKVVFDCPDDTPNYDQIIAWMRRVCEGGARVVIVDPITAVDAGKNPWETDKAFMAQAKAILRRYGASLILVTHPRSSNNKTSHDDAAGSRAFGRFCQTMMWLKRCDPAVRARVRGDAGETFFSVDRLIVLVKVRNSKGQGMRLAYQFDKASLLFGEQGMLVKIIKNKEADDEAEGD